MSKFFNGWESADDLQKDFLGYGEFDKGERLEGFPADEEILFASYEQGGYEGDSLVLFQRDGKFYYNSASHCSCYGLEGQWSPDEVIPAQLVKMSGPGGGHGAKALKAWKAIMQTINPQPE